MPDVAPQFSSSKISHYNDGQANEGVGSGVHAMRVTLCAAINRQDNLHCGVKGLGWCERVAAFIRVPGKRRFKRQGGQSWTNARSVPSRIGQKRRGWTSDCHLNASSMVSYSALFTVRSAGNALSYSLTCRGVTGAERAETCKKSGGAAMSNGTTRCGVQWTWPPGARL